VGGGWGGGGGGGGGAGPPGPLQSGEKGKVSGRGQWRQSGPSYNKIQTKKDAVSLQRPFCYTAI